MKDSKNKKKLKEIAESKKAVLGKRHTSGITFGSGSLNFKKFKPGDDWPDPDGPATPVDAVSIPDFGIQFDTCFPLPEEQRQDIQDQIQAAFSGADVRGPVCSSGTDRIGIWYAPTSSTFASDARNRGLAQLSIHEDGQAFTAFINGSTLRTQALREIRSRGFQFDHSGNPDPDGPVIINGIRLSYKETSNQVVLTVNGYDTSFWPDVDFQITITDTLSVASGKIHCVTDTDISVDRTFLHILTILTTILAAAIPGLFVIPLTLLEADIVIGALDAPASGTGGVGKIAAQRFPGIIFLPEGRKMQFYYNAIRVTTGGIIAGGDFSIDAREPRVTIYGPEQISIDRNLLSVTVQFKVGTFDMRHPVTCVWSGGNIVSQNNTTVAIKFPLPAAGQPIITKSISVSVLDIDDLDATDSFQIKIYRINHDDEDVSPICRAKPWLAQCQ